VASVVEQHEVPIGNVVEDRDADLERHHRVGRRPASPLNLPQSGFSLFMISGNAGAQRKET
jgi:hypothetical protein